MRNLEPFILETIISNLKPGASGAEVKEFKNKHVENLAVSVHTTEVDGQDALSVNIYMGSGLIDAVIAILGPYMTGISMDDVATTWKDWAKRNALTTATSTVSALLRATISQLFKNGKLDLTFLVTNMWRADSLKAEAMAEEGKYTWAYVKTANFMYKAYLTARKRPQEKTELSMEQINQMLTAKIRSKIHG